ncbi:hypothetical protein BLA29_012098 [Euroglyphus maynei]|uniref:Uncharacterized protein n=1 Tax=Euroglyphus maynei TaxID=6958 RepID=A0A1Y3BIE2_EURMA|nr:hypothetical protein BLA29_012098 [Euroglyphus maynei]
MAKYYYHHNHHNDNHMRRKCKLTNPQQSQLFCYYREHNVICNDYQHSYDELWGKALLVYLILSIPFDAIGISAYWIDELIWIDLLNKRKQCIKRVIQFQSLFNL